MIAKIIRNILVVLLISTMLSMLNALSNSGEGQSACRTYGYYLPATFLMCNINKTR